MSDRLYLDHAATTPILPETAAAVADAMGRWANPSSPHADGRRARAQLEAARERIAAALGWTGAVIFTSGASEAIAIAMTRAKAARRLVSAVEHDAVMRIAPDARRLEVDGKGRVALEGVEAGDLVAMQSANNETGVMQPPGEHGAIVRESGAMLLADCAQSAGKLPLPDADFIAISAHKLGGPPGIGALLVRDLALLTASGGQEQGYRAGTENLPGVLGFAAALDAAVPWMERAALLRARLEQALAAQGGVIVAGDAPRIPTIGAYRMPGTAATAQLIQFDLAGISVSAGSACSSGSMKPSHVLSAMGLADDVVRETIRVSFGPDTTAQDIDRFTAEWARIAGRAKAQAA